VGWIGGYGGQIACYGDFIEFLVSRIWTERESVG